MLSAESSDQRDRALLARYREHGDEAAREQLAAEWVPVCKRLVQRFRRKGDSADELVGVAMLGLAKAIDRYDLSRTSPFGAYATPTILGEVRRYIRDQGWTIRVARSAQERIVAINRKLPELTQTLGRSPTVREIAASIDATPEEVVDALDAESVRVPASLASSGPDDTQTSTLEDAVGELDVAYEKVENQADLGPELRSLPTRERTIVYLRFVSELSQAEIASRLGISQMHVSRLLRKSLAELRERSAEQGSSS